MKIKKLLAAAVAMLCTAGAWAQSVGDIITYDGAEYEVKGTNLITNGSFEDGVAGWYSGNWNSASASNYTLQAEGGFDGGAYLQYSAGGVGADTNIRGKWSVESGKTYLFRCYTSGSAPSSNNLQYSALKVYDESQANYEGATLYQLVWGASTEWTENNFVFTATSAAVTFRSSWTTNAKLDGFVLVEIERYFSPEGYNNAMDAAKAALEDEAYANVTGEERTALQNVIAAYTNATSDKYEEAILALDEATATFKAAKASYDAFAAAKAVEAPVLAYAAEAKKTALEEAKAAAPTSADDAVAKTAAITTALRAYYESHALAEGVEGATNLTSKLNNPTNPSNLNGWTLVNVSGDSKLHINKGESYTNADGTEATGYFDSNSWNKAFTARFTQDVTLDAGKYILTMKSRGNGINVFQVIAGEEATDMTPVIGASGGVFGRGWNDYTVEFELDAKGAVTLGTYMESSANSNWLSFSDFRLVRLELYTELAGAEDYAALNAAIEAVEDKVLGFDAGEYAPYNNVEAVAALAAAKAVDQTIENGKEEITALTDALTNATWTANTEEVNAIFDGQFATTEANATSGDINLPGWTKVEGIRLLVKDEATDPGLAYTDGKAAVFSWGGTTLTYGEQDGYTLPLDQHELYEVTLKVSAWRDGDFPTVLTVNLDGNAQTVNPEALGVKKINEAEGNPFASVRFVLEAAAEADSKLTIYANHHFTIADLKLVKAQPEDVAIAVSEAGYATTIIPFDAEVPAGLTVAEVTGVEGNELVLNEVSAIEANKPYVVSGAAGTYTVSGIVPSGLAASYTEGLLTGVYAATPAPVGSYVLQNLNEQVAFYQVAEGAQPTVGANRAYLTAPAGSEVKAFVLGGTTDAIHAAEAAEAENGAIYNLAGQRLQKAAKGVNIIKGKKVFIK